MNDTKQETRQNLVFVLLVLLVCILLVGITSLLILNQTTQPDSFSNTNLNNRVTVQSDGEVSQNITEMIRQEIQSYLYKQNSGDISVSDINSQQLLNDTFLSKYVPIYPGQTILQTDAKTENGMAEYYFVIHVPNVDYNNLISFYSIYGAENGWILENTKSQIMELIDYKTNFGKLEISLMDFLADSTINGTVVVLRIIESS